VNAHVLPRPLGQSGSEKDLAYRLGGDSKLVGYLRLCGTGEVVGIDGVEIPTIRGARVEGVFAWLCP
jgi:hypothetical protein